MSELPYMKVSINGEQLVATPENTSLFQFAGTLANRSHIFIATETEDDTTIGAYIFADLQPEYDQMLVYMTDNSYPLHVNLREVADCDEDAFQRHIGNIATAAAEQLDDELDKLLENGDGTA